MITLEVCCADIGSVRAAIKGGAHRIELCSALEVGGLTPSAAIIEAASSLCRQSGVRLHVLIRPRPGDYLYSRDEISIMGQDIEIAARMGADGAVIGVLDADGSVDFGATAHLAGLARSLGLSVTFHRAFDLCNDPFEAMQAIAEAGVSRILTSGQAPSAPEGQTLIAELVRRAPEHLTILAGAGINSANADVLVAATGVTEIHASVKARVSSRMTFRLPGIAMGAEGSDEYSRFATDAAEVAAIINSIRQL